MTDTWRADAAAWWSGPEWAAYETAYGDAPGTRTKLLAEATWNTRILSLEPEPRALLRGMRKGRRAEIRAAERASLFETDPDAVTFHKYFYLHVTAHHTPRPRATYDEQEAWMRAGHGLPIVASQPGTYHPNSLAAAYFIVNNTWSYYGSSAALVPNVMGAVVWRGMLALKARGVTTLELGWQGHATDDKGRNVERFKAHFGGLDVPARLP